MKIIDIIDDGREETESQISILKRAEKEEPIESKILKIVGMSTAAVIALVMKSKFGPDLDNHIFSKEGDYCEAHQICYKKGDEGLMFINANNSLAENLEKIKELALAIKLSQELKEGESLFIKNLVTSRINGEIKIGYKGPDSAMYYSGVDTLKSKSKEALIDIENQIEKTKKDWVFMPGELNIGLVDKRNIEEYILNGKSLISLLEKTTTEETI